MACEGRIEPVDVVARPRSRGRPRSTGAERAILRAGARLLAERGVTRTSMEAIAVAAHVSKATIYRRWPSKDALILELITRAADELPGVEEPSSGDTRADLQEWVRRALDEERSPLGAALQQLVRRAAEDPALAANLRRRELRRHRDRFAAILERGVSAGQVRPNLDLPTLLDMLSGPALYRRLLDPVPPAMPDPGDQARMIIDIVWPGIRAEREPGHQG